LLGRSERGAEAIAEAIRFTATAKKFEWTPLDRGCKGEYYFGVGGKIFWVGRKITNF